uniref:DUF4291 domain-containing protein n=1 Tax=Plectus sambesii TaxID=2011161 RepID=A0A914WJP3_9BILA
MAISRITLPMDITLYCQQAKLWPSRGQHILAHYDDQSIVVYQAYNQQIAKAAVQANNFHAEPVLQAGYSMSRMSWIKTNFLWMMYRSGWASKPNQTNILAIRISRQGFEEILLNATTQGSGPVRLQWDPDHTPSGEKITERRAIQLGLRDNMIEKFSRDFIIRITDITDFARDQAQNAVNSCDSLTMPVERVYACLNDDAAKNVNIDVV